MKGNNERSSSMSRTVTKAKAAGTRRNKLQVAKNKLTGRKIKK